MYLKSKLVFQLDEQLNLARVQGLERAAVRGESCSSGCIVRADAQWIGMIHQVEGFHSHLQKESFLPEVKRFIARRSRLTKAGDKNGLRPSANGRAERG